MTEPKANGRTPVIAVISDTHGLLRPEATPFLQTSKHIIHAGDVGDPTILMQLEAIAPLTVVRGNIDVAPWANRLPKTAAWCGYDLNCYVVHNIDDLDLNPKQAGLQFVVYGHSHRPSIERREGVWFLNPGSAGPRRFKLPVTLARIYPYPAAPHIELIDVLSGVVLQSV